MNRTVLQIPLDKDLKANAEKAALSQGFSSVQELVRVFLSKVASNKIEVTLQDTVMLSEINEKRYIDMTVDFESGKNTGQAKDADDLINKLHENQIS
ncbi:MAG: hypothetical protein WD992_00930 [Candidatus Levyibacteriota bacterium]